MKERLNPVNLLRAGWFALIALVAVIAIIDGSLAVVLLTLGVGLLLLLVPAIMIDYDRHPDRRHHRPGPA